MHARAEAVEHQLSTALEAHAVATAASHKMEGDLRSQVLVPASCLLLTSH